MFSLKYNNYNEESKVEASQQKAEEDIPHHSLSPHPTQKDQRLPHQGY